MHIVYRIHHTNGLRGLCHAADQRGRNVQGNFTGRSEFCGIHRFQREGILATTQPEVEECRSVKGLHAEVLIKVHIANQDLAMSPAVVDCIVAMRHWTR